MDADRFLWSAGTKLVVVAVCLVCDLLIFCLWIGCCYIAFRLGGWMEKTGMPVFWPRAYETLASVITFVVVCCFGMAEIRISLQELKRVWNEEDEGDEYEVEAEEGGA